MTEKPANALGRGSAGSKKRSTVDPVALSAEVFGEPLYTVQQAADAIGVSAETLRDWIKAGDVLALRFGGKEYRITQSALRKYKEDREAEAKAESEGRREARRQAARLARLQAEEPWAYWEQTPCPGCWDTKLLTTRQQRKAPSFLCELCTLVMQAGEPFNTGQRYAREVRIQVAEYNAEAGMHPDAPPPYVIYSCGVCEKPQMLSVEQIADPTFYPYCSHAKGWTELYMREQSGHRDTRVLNALTNLELETRIAQWRSGESDRGQEHERPYWLEICHQCATHNVVVFYEDVESGSVPPCRECRRRQAEQDRLAGLSQVVPVAPMDDADNLDDVPF